MDLPESLQTERLVLRRMRPDDAEVQHAMWEERDPRVPARRRIDADGHPTVDEIRASLDPAAGAQRGLLSVVRRDTGEVIGYCGLLIAGQRGTAEVPELAYELLRAAHGRGYATEAAAAVVAWADDAGIRRLQAGVRDWNTHSLRVLAKLGFVPSGTVDPDPVHGDSILLVRATPR